MYMRKIIDDEKFRLYCALRREKEKFIKSLDIMRHCEWVIHKKLLDERRKRFYTYIGRGNGKWATIDRYLELLQEGRGVTVIHPRGGYPRPTKNDVDRFVQTVADYGLSGRDSLNEYFINKIKEHFDKSLLYPYDKPEIQWKPVIRHDSKLLENPYKNPYIYNDWTFGSRLSTGFVLIDGVSND